MSLYDRDYLIEEELETIFSNLVVLKKMHDRGFDVSGIPLNDSIFSYCLERMFGNIEFTPYTPKPDKKLEELYGNEEDEELIETEEWCNYHHFYGEREHFQINLPIPQLKLLSPFEISMLGRELNKSFRVNIYNLLEYVPENSFFYNWKWYRDDNGDICGITLYFVDIFSQAFEYPPPSEEVLSIIELLDLINDMVKNREEGVVVASDTSPIDPVA